MKATDKTILILCSECPGNHMEEGYSAMVAHIKSDHKNYTGDEPEVYAGIWMEAAYDREETFLSDYYKQRQLDKAIDADREYQTHKI